MLAVTRFAGAVCGPGRLPYAAARRQANRAGPGHIRFPLPSTAMRTPGPACSRGNRRAADVALRDSPFEARPGVAGDESVTVTLAGELDLSTEGALAAQLDGIRAGRPRQVIFDMSQVSFADLGALRALVTVGGQDALPPVLCHPPPVVVRLLEVSGLAGHCVIVR
jgi:anti-anti-sigma factor